MSLCLERRVCVFGGIWGSYGGSTYDLMDGNLRYLLRVPSITHLPIGLQRLLFDLHMH